MNNNPGLEEVLRKKHVRRDPPPQPQAVPSKSEEHDEKEGTKMEKKGQFQYYL